ncbi:MAG: class I SAM-dependent methyltransferase [Bacteroidota bacterium]
MDSTKRFSDRVQDYIRYRPEYPAKVISYLQERNLLLPGDAVADLGSGTGKSSIIFLQKGIKTFGIEPNEAMRFAAEDLLSSFSHFESIDGTAEQTTLPDHSIKLAVAGQAFHWFDIPKARREVQRILQPNGYALLLYNIRADDASGFMKDYHQFLLDYSTDYRLINKRKVDPIAYQAFFGHAHYESAQFPNQQVFDLEGLKGRYFSCSYALPDNHPNFVEALEKLEVLFDQYQKNGQLEMIYRTEIFWGHLKD